MRVCPGSDSYGSGAAAAARECRELPGDVELQRSSRLSPVSRRNSTASHDVIVTSPTDGGLGPRFNSNSCASCHAYPAVGGSSPPSNPLFAVYNYNGAQNTMPSFITSNGPILEARFINQPGTTIPDGTVHQLFTITGRSDAASCNISQPDFVTAASQGNLVLRQVISNLRGRPDRSGSQHRHHQQHEFEPDQKGSRWALPVIPITAGTTVAFSASGGRRRFGRRC